MVRMCPCAPRSHTFGDCTLPLSVSCTRTCNLLLTVLVNPFSFYLRYLLFLYTHSRLFLIHTPNSISHVFCINCSLFTHIPTMFFALFLIILRQACLFCHVMFSVDLVYHLRTHDICSRRMRRLDLEFTDIEIRDCCHPQGP